MSYLEAVLIAEARRTGRAQRTASRRHVRLAKRPLGIVLWQLGAEPFTAAAAAWGFGPKAWEMVVPGEPRDRTLAFRALTIFAKDFNSWLESGGGGTGEPQIVLPNQGTLRLFARLGRRLAFLPTDGDRPADPELVRFGRHLSFLGGHARMPGQQLVVVLTDLLSSHWVSELSPLEAQNLPALDAVIDPPSTMNAHEAAAIAEDHQIGPLPSAPDDEKLGELLTEFNRARARSTDADLVASLLPPIHAHYEALVRRGWPLLWRCLDRERVYTEAAHVERRWNDDVEALNRHLEWVVTRGGRYRTRQTSAQAAYTLRGWEEAERLLVAEQAIDDPLRMIPYLLANDAIRGTVAQVDLEHREIAKVKKVRRPLVTLQTEEPCVVGNGKKLFWTETPSGQPYEVVEVVAHGTGSRVVLKHHAPGDVRRPTLGDTVILSVHNTNPPPPLMLPKKPPWTHGRPPPPPPAIEDPETAGGWE